MNKTKQTILALGISLVVILISNLIYMKYIQKDSKIIYVLNSKVLAGEKVSIEKLQKTEMICKESYINEKEISTYLSEYILRENINKGQILSKDLFISKTDYDIENKDEYKISIPIKDSSYAVSYQLKRGDKINIYYTSRINQTDQILKNYEKKYSSNNADSFLTCKLLENISIINTYNDSGSQSQEGSKFKEIVISTSNEMALLISNLKEQGEFNICLSNK